MIICHTNRLIFSAVHPEVASGLPQRPRRQLGPAVRPRRGVPPRAEAEAAPAPRPQEPQPAPRQPRTHTQGTGLNPVVLTFRVAVEIPKIQIIRHK